MTEERCECKACTECGESDPPLYWCEVCKQPSADKRCPLCGLKTRRNR